LAVFEIRGTVADPGALYRHFGLTPFQRLLEVKQLTLARAKASEPLRLTLVADVSLADLTEADGRPVALKGVTVQGPLEEAPDLLLAALNRALRRRVGGGVPCGLGDTPQLLLTDLALRLARRDPDRTTLELRCAGLLASSAAVFRFDDLAFDLDRRIFLSDAG